MAIMTGCAQKVLRPSINEATIRLLNRHGVEVVHARGTECCGALAHHMGKEDAGRRAAKANIEAWMREYNRGGLDAIVVNASGCGTMVKDYGHMFQTIRTTRKKRRGFRRSPRISPRSRWNLA